jgi:hypothetical protein
MNRRWFLLLRPYTTAILTLRCIQKASCDPENCPKNSQLLGEAKLDKLTKGREEKMEQKFVCSFGYQHLEIVSVSQKLYIYFLFKKAAQKEIFHDFKPVRMGTM